MPHLPFHLIAPATNRIPPVADLIAPVKINQQTTKPHQYIGRFAPSPSGPLHFGSLVAALGSYLQAKNNEGLWLVRIEDIDPPREIEGASDDILRTLELFGLNWDGDVMYQSTRADQYRQALAWLKEQGLTYHCQCTRKQINQNAQYAGVYNQTCRPINLSITDDNGQGRAIRLKNSNPTRAFDDILQGSIQSHLPANVSDDFIIHRKDGLFAYQLAVVIDDIAQGITQIVRGSDLLTTSLNQITLFNSFGYPPPSYLHLPVAVTQPGKKLSKQNHAAPINSQSTDSQQVNTLLIKALTFLGFEVPKTLISQDKRQILAWAINHWNIKKLPNKREISINANN